MAANIFTVVPVPPADGVGASVSMVGQGLKTFVIGGTFNATVVIEIGIGGNFAPAFVIDKAEQFRDIPIVAEDVRVRIVNYRSGTPTVEVGGSPSVDTFSAILVPPANGFGVALDTSLFGQNKTLIVAGTFNALVTLEGAESVAGPWAPLVRIDKGSNFFNTSIITQFVRVVITNYIDGVITASLGAADFNVGGGVTLQDAYDASADGRIVDDTTRGAVKIRASNAIGSDVFTLEDSAGATILNAKGIGDIEVPAGQIFATPSIVAPGYSFTGLPNYGLGQGGTDVRLMALGQSLVIADLGGISLNKNTSCIGRITATHYRAGNGTAADPSYGITAIAGGGGLFKGAGNSLAWSVQGAQRMKLTSGQLQIGGAGAVATPALAIGNETDTGFFEPLANEIAITNFGVETIRFTSTNQTVLPDASFALPSLTFDGDRTTGLYLDGAALAFTQNGTKKMSITAAFLTMSTQISAITGTVTAPSIRSNGDADSGLFFRAVGECNITAAGLETLRCTTGQCLGQNGTNSLPTWGFIADPSSGTYRDAATKEIVTAMQGLDCFSGESGGGAGDTRLLVYDIDNGQLERVSVGAADSGGVGFKLLRIAN
tara:strand:- start:5873 stop:7678 length:1806 start_codon:yes stop_codon:yes gene_type:complete